MSVILKIAVADGVVMGADSRSTLLRGDKRPQVFDGVQKIFVLHKDYPAAMLTWGLNRLNDVSVTQLMEDVRRRLEGNDPDHADWKIDLGKSSLAEISERVSNYLFHDHYQKVEQANPSVSSMNLHFAGYSPGDRKPTHVEYSFSKDHIVGPTQSNNADVQLNYAGGPYLIRLLSGSDQGLMGKLVEAGIDREVAEKTFREFSSAAFGELLHPGIPLRHVAALVRSLLNAEIDLRRMGPEPDTVGGDIQMVVIDRHGCREMKFKPIDFEIPDSVWKR